MRHVHSLPVRKVLFYLILHMQDQCTAADVGQFLVRLLQETGSWMLFLLIFSVMDQKVHFLLIDKLKSLCMYPKQIWTWKSITENICQ